MKLFSYQWPRTQSRFETEAWSNLEMARKWHIEGAHDPQALAYGSFMYERQSVPKTFDQDCKCRKSR